MRSALLLTAMLAACGPTATGDADAHAGVDAHPLDAAPADAPPATPDAPLAGTPLNETDLPAEADYCVDQFPKTTTIAASTPLTLYGQLYEKNLTDTSSTLAAGVTAELGISPKDAGETDPRTATGWSFLSAIPNPGYDFAQNNDEYQVTITPAAAGVYRFAWRFSFDGGASWTYCDNDGAGSDTNLDFSPAQTGTLTVQ